MIRPIFQLFILLSKLVSKVEFLRNFVKRFSLINRLYLFIFYNLRPKKSTVIEVQGSKMLIDPRHGIGADIWGTGFWEKMETEIMREYVKEGMIVVDVGANIGYYSLLAARLIGKAGKVYAFEPNPEIYKTLIKNIKMNGYTNIFPVQKAVSNSNGVARFFINAKASGGHRLLNNEDEKSTIEVDIITLDNFFRNKRYKVDLIKMDIEGAEMFALEGMQRILNENKNLVIFSEFSPYFLKLLGVRPEDYLNKLAENGFKMYEIDEWNQVICDVDFSEIVKEYDEHGIIRYPTILCKRETGR